MRKVLIVLILFTIFNISCGGDDSSVDYESDPTTIEPGQQLAADADWYKDAVFYHIWVKAFNDGKYDDNIGDIQGIINKLDYLNDGDSSTDTDLGITAIWLSPIFECAYKEDNMHGYDSTDMYSINNRFGTREDVKNLLNEAHSRGIRVIFDFVPNHISISHSWVSEHSDWFVWDNSPSTSWTYAWSTGGSWSDVWTSRNNSYYYHAFTSDMIDINYYNSDAKNAMKSVLTYWLDRGFDGVRFDAVRYLCETGPGQAADQPDTHSLLQEYRTTVDSYSSSGNNKFFVSEAWVGSHTDITPYYGDGTNETNMCFDFAYAYAVRNAVNNYDNPDYITELVPYEISNYPSGFQSATFLSNHDEVLSRPATLYGSNKNKMILAAAMNILSHGTPFIYYGEEVGMSDGSQSGDLRLRQPMSWSSVTSQTGDADSILSWYRYLIKAKLTYEPLRTSNLEIVNDGSDGDGVLAFLRKNRAGNEYMGMVINLSGGTITKTIDFGVGSDGPVSTIIGEPGSSTMISTSYTFNSIPGYGFRVIYIGDGSKPQIAGDVQ